MCDDGKQQVTLTHTRDFAVGITGLFLNPKSYGEDFNIVGDRVYTWNDVICIIEEHTGKKAKIVNVKTETIAEEISSLREELLFDKGRSHRFDNKKLKDAVPEFITNIDLDTGLGETVEFLMSDEKSHVYDTVFHATENVLCKKYGADVKVTLKQHMSHFYNENISFKRIKRKLKGKG